MHFDTLVSSSAVGARLYECNVLKLFMVKNNLRLKLYLCVFKSNLYVLP
jgi:hypothetical protein